MDIRELSGGEVGGYVGLYYLVLAYRGKGFGRVLDDYAIRVFKRRGLRVAQLSMSPSNMRAVRGSTRGADGGTLGSGPVGPRCI